MPRSRAMRRSVRPVSSGSPRPACTPAHTSSASAGTRSARAVMRTSPGFFSSSSRARFALASSVTRPPAGSPSPPAASVVNTARVSETSSFCTTAVTFSPTSGMGNFSVSTPTRGKRTSMRWLHCVPTPGGMSSPTSTSMTPPSAKAGGVQPAGSTEAASAPVAGVSPTDPARAGAISPSRTSASYRPRSKSVSTSARRGPMACASKR